MSETLDREIQTCSSYSTLCYDLFLSGELQSTAVQAAQTLQGTGDFAEIRPSCNVNPVAAKREWITERRVTERGPGACLLQRRFYRFSRVWTKWYVGWLEGCHQHKASVTDVDVSLNADTIYWLCHSFLPYFINFILNMRNLSLLGLAQV